MNTLENFQILNRYNTWMNEKLYEVCAKIDDAERKRDCGAPLASMHGTLNHILLTDRAWMSRFQNAPMPKEIRALDQELYANFEELRRERQAQDEIIANYVNGLTPEELEQPLTFRGMSNPAEFTCPLNLALLHFFNHQTHHRGQLTTLIEQSGHDCGVTDLLRMPDAQIIGSPKSR